MSRRLFLRQTGSAVRLVAAVTTIHLGRNALTEAQERPSSNSVRLLPSGPRPSKDDHVCCLLERLFEGLSDGHDIPQDDTDKIEASGGHDAYGELTVRGMRELLRLMQPGDNHQLRSRPSQLLPTPRAGHAIGHEASASEVFYDLGSGRGASVVQAVLEWPVDRAVGIELSPSRDAVGRAALARAQASTDVELRAVGERVELRRDDMIACVGCEDATLIYVASLLFDDTFMKRLGERLSQLPRVRCVASLRPFPPGSLGPNFVADSDNFRSDDDPSTLADRVEVTWGRARVYLYRRGS